MYQFFFLSESHYYPLQITANKERLLVFLYNFKAQKGVLVFLDCDVYCRKTPNWKEKKTEVAWANKFCDIYMHLSSVYLDQTKYVHTLFIHFNFVAIKIPFKLHIIGGFQVSLLE